MGIKLAAEAADYSFRIVVEERSIRAEGRPRGLLDFMEVSMPA